MNLTWLRLQRWRWRTKATNELLKQRLSEPVHDLGFLLSRYVAIDLETTSLDPKLGEIVSIGWVVIEEGEIQLNQSQYFPITPKQEVGQSAVFHQLTDSQLADAYPLQNAMEALLHSIRNSVLVFHNANLDMGFINHYLTKKWGAPLLYPLVDTLEQEKKTLLRKQEHIKPGELRLFQCRQRYGLPEVELHNALGDALATAELWLAINAQKSH